ncbi:hypothetical protein, partial [Streptomyces griseoruber]|uniref:hypothetical protein n=1 Tax=Streptomyces griseoruber TaxID=1943 RepID=UPI003B8A7B79
MAVTMMGPGAVGVPARRLVGGRGAGAVLVRRSSGQVIARGAAGQVVARVDDRCGGRVVADAAGVAEVGVEAVAEVDVLPGRFGGVGSGADEGGFLGRGVDSGGVRAGGGGVGCLLY